MKILHSRLVRENVYALLAILISLLGFALLITRNPTLWFGIALLVTAILRKWRYLAFSLAFLAVLLLIYTFAKSDPVNGPVSGNYEVMKRTAFGFVIKENGNRIFVFSKVAVLPGDEVFISGKSFDYKGKMEAYFRSLNVRSVISYPYAFKVKTSYSIPNYLRLFFTTHDPKYNGLVSLLFFGEKTVGNNDFYNLTRQMNIAHLFVISGFHISVLHFGIKKLVFFLKKINRDIISFLIIGNYLFIIGFPISALRATIMLFILTFARYIKKVKITRLEVMTISLAIIIMIDPHSIFGYSLPLTFISTFIILNILHLQISNFKKMLLIPFLMFVVMLPFTIIFNQKISVTGPLYNLIITPVFTIFYLLFIISMPLYDVAGFLSQWFSLMLEKLHLLNITIGIKKDVWWVFLMPYLFATFSFIMYEGWNSFLARKNI